MTNLCSAVTSYSVLCTIEAWFAFLQSFGPLTESAPTVPDLESARSRNALKVSSLSQTTEFQAWVENHPGVVGTCVYTSLLHGIHRIWADLDKSQLE